MNLDLMFSAPNVLLQLAWLLGMALITLLVTAVPGAHQPHKLLVARTLVVWALTIGVMLPLLAPTYAPDVLALLAGVPLAAFVQVTPLTLFIGFFISLLAVVVMFGMPEYYTRKRLAQPEMVLLLLLSVLGMQLLLHADHLLILYIGLELMSFPLYILTASLREDAKSSEAGLKYFILGSLVSGVLLYGMSLLYALTGALSFPEIAAVIAGLHAAEQPVVVVSLVLMLGAMLFKLAAVPFQVWAPDVYEGAPLPITLVLATLPKVTAVVVLLNLLLHVFAPVLSLWQPLLALVAVASMLLGAVLAIVQTNLKRLLAYSAIAQVGFVLAGMLALDDAAVRSVLFYLVTYMFTVVGIFGALLGLRNHGTYVTQLAQLTGLFRLQPLYAAALLIFFLSVAGIPPFVGFFAKVYVFESAFAAGYDWVVYAGIASSMIGLFYSLYIVKLMFFDPPPAQQTFEANVPAEVHGMVLLGVVAVLGLFLSHGWLLDALTLLSPTLR